ncbi:sulfotransferase domain-containing protein [Namhaeicola litoreus]|uniref:Sulfotransferase domain-containing protein n=1 Tax=Namhaeicola litoreus TaxID=1052145 RepID=A0ABW3Y5B5_9FLAO
MKFKDYVKKYIPPKYEMYAGTVYHNFLSIFRRKIKIDKNEKIVIVVSSPHKVGSTWIYNILRRLTGFHDIFPPYKIFTEYRKVKIPLDDLIPYFNKLKNGKGYIFKSHSLPPKKSESYIRYITVIRDPRDVFVSLAHYVSNLPVELGGWGEEFRNKTIKSKITDLIEKGDFMFDLYNEWSNYDNCLLLKYEDLKSDIYSCTNQIVKYCSVNAPIEQIEKAINLNDFAKVSGRKSGVENKKSFYRKGIVGDWKNIFDEELLNILYTSKKGRWKILIEELGYPI